MHTQLVALARDRAQGIAGKLSTNFQHRHIGDGVDRANDFMLQHEVASLLNAGLAGEGER